MNKREKPSRSSRRMFNNLNLLTKEKRQSKMKNTKIWRSHKESSLRHMKLKIRSSQSKMTNSIRHFLKGNWVLENKLMGGRVNTMKSRENTLSLRVNLIRKKLFGKTNLSSTRSKRSKPRRTKKKTSFNSNRPQISYKRLKMNQRTSTTPTIRQLLVSSKKSSRLRCHKLQRIQLVKSTILRALLEDLRRKTNNYKKKLS